MASLQSELHNTTLPWLHLMDVLKHLPRTGWLRFIDRPESVAAHMYRMALIAMSAPKGLDRDKCIKLALIHDMGEAVAGDLTPHDGVSKAEKYKLEEFGFKYIESLLKKVNPELGQELMDLWIEFEVSETPEAKWMNEVDKFECMIQAHDYEQQTLGEQPGLAEFQGPYNAAKIHSASVKEDLRLLTLEREAHFANRKQQLRLIFLLGVPGSGEKSQAEHLAKDLGIKIIDVQELILEKVKDQSYIHSEFLAECIENSVRAPTTLVVGLLEHKVKEATNGRKDWVIVVGFPDSMQQLVGFQRQVQKNTHILLLKSSIEPLQISDKKLATAYQDLQELEIHLNATGEYFKTIDAGGSAETVYGKLKEVVIGITK